MDTNNWQFLPIIGNFPQLLVKISNYWDQYFSNNPIWANIFSNILNEIFVNYWFDFLTNIGLIIGSITELLVSPDWVDLLYYVGLD